MSDPELYCEPCDKNFSRKGDLRRHERGIHAQEKPWVCQFVLDAETGRKCLKAFAQRTGMKTHENVHTKNTPFKCGVNGCKKSFGDPSSCARHRKELHTEETHQCPVAGCSSSIKRKSPFKKHMLEKHGQIYSDSDAEACLARRRKAPSGSRRRKSSLFFTPAPPPAHHKSMEKSQPQDVKPGPTSTVYTNESSYANHPPPNYFSQIPYRPTSYLDSHYPNNLYYPSLPSIISRPVSRSPVPDLTFSPSTSSSSSVCPTPEPVVTQPLFSSDRDIKMFLDDLERDAWTVTASGATTPYQTPEPYQYVPEYNIVDGVRIVGH